MISTVNTQIRAAAKQAGVFLWQVAEAYGLNDGNFSRKLRRELSPQERDKILEIIQKIARENEEVS